MLTPLAPVPEEAFDLLIEELSRQPIPVNKYRERAGEGRSAAFGFVNKRCLPPDLSRLCWTRPYLYHLLLDFGRRYCPIPFNAITINQNYAASAHRDKGNAGVSYLVAFGDYQNGELQILEPDCSGVYNIRHQPVLFDGAKLLHAVKPFQGERYSLVYYTLSRETAKTLAQYEPFQDPADKKWKLLYTDGEGLKHVLKRGQGLPHPLAGRRAKKCEAAAAPEPSIATSFQDAEADASTCS